MNKGRVTVRDVIAMKREGTKIAVLTAYSYSIARIVDGAGIPVVLVGDSVGMVEAGCETTLPVTMDEMIYHTRCVSRACKRALVVGDMPFMSYQVSVEEALFNAGRFVKEAGAGAVKLEGGQRSALTIETIVQAGIPVMAHIGLTPQSVHAMGGYRVQGRTKDAADVLVQDAIATAEAGAFAIVLEGMPTGVAKAITSAVPVPTIGIGAGVNCDGQVLVINDMLGLDVDENAKSPKPKFVKKYADLGRVITKAVSAYKRDVEKGRFPTVKHSYK